MLFFRIFEVLGLRAAHGLRLSSVADMQLKGSYPSE